MKHIAQPSHSSFLTSPASMEVSEKNKRLVKGIISALAPYAIAAAAVFAYHEQFPM